MITGDSSNIGDTADYAFLFSGDSMINLGSLGGTLSAGLAINSTGEVVGYSALNNNVGTDAFLYSNGAMTDIEYPGAFDTYAYSINDSGQIVGLYRIGTAGTSQAFLYSNGTFTDLGIVGSAQAINNAGQIAGYGSFSDGLRAFLYSGGVTTELGAPLSGQFCYSSGANGINNLGQVVGGEIWNDVVTLCGETYNEHAFVYDDGTLTDIGMLGGSYPLASAQSINDVGQVVGTSSTTPWSPTLSAAKSHAFLYSNDVMQDLNSLIDPRSPLATYVTLTDATAINNNGVITANGLDSRTGSSKHAYVLTPAP